MARMRWLIVIVIGLLTCQASRADTVSIVGNGAASTEGLGAFTGSMSYNAANSSTAQLVVQLHNSSPPGNGGYITAFAMNNPGNQIGSITFAATNAAWGLLGSAPFNNGVSAPPFGSFDFGASITGSFLGGGSPVTGIGVGQTVTFTFDLTGSDLDDLTTADFLSETGVDPSPEHAGESFLVRFRGFANDGSDKVPGRVRRQDDGGGDDDDDPQVPEPGTFILCGLLGLGLLARRKTSKRAA